MAARGLYRTLRKLGVEQKAISDVMVLGEKPVVMSAGFTVIKRLSMAKRVGQIENYKESISYQRYIHYLLSEAADVILSPGPVSGKSTSVTATIRCPTGSGGGVHIPGKQEPLQQITNKTCVP